MERSCGMYIFFKIIVLIFFRYCYKVKIRIYLSLIFFEGGFGVLFGLVFYENVFLWR